MPRGVSDQFLRILKNERKASVRALALVAALSLAAYFMAELTDEPFFGRVVLLCAVLLLCGVGLGVLWGRHRTNAYNESLRASWNAWMRMSISCASVHEVARHVRNAPPSPRLAGVGWAVLLVVNAVLFAILWSEVAWGPALGAAVTAANGLVLGGVAGEALWSLRWTRDFSRALDDLMAEGQVGLWGEV